MIRPASWTPLSASIVTVAGWPTLTLVMSDSLKETVIWSALGSMIWANADELDDEDDAGSSRGSRASGGAPAP